MPSPLITYAFTAGELSRTLWNRTDFEKYDLGPCGVRELFCRLSRWYIDQAWVDLSRIPQTRHYEFQNGGVRVRGYG